MPLSSSNKIFLCIAVHCCFFFFNSFSQSFTRDTLPVKVNNQFLKNAWTGGHNFCQFSQIDLNFDGIKDLFVFDRSGNKITTYINGGTPNAADYIHAPQYQDSFPLLHDWVLFADYNCDGKEDIFSYSNAGFCIWKNTSVTSLQFTLDSANMYFDGFWWRVMSDYGFNILNLFVSPVDIPAISDIDNDGDMDVLTFDWSGVIMEYHSNKSAELGYGCDSLLFELDQNGCWGNFSENPDNCSILLNQSCRMFNSDSTPFPSGRVGDGLHSGSCALCMDMDADGDKDLLVGDVSCCNMILLVNGGNDSSANITSFTDSFPSNTQKILQTVFPCGYFLDVNNDGKRDLLVSPNSVVNSLNKESIWFYQNINSDSAPVFSFVKNNFLQDEMIDVGEGSYPVFFDYNSDGITDILIGNYNRTADSCPGSIHYNLTAYKNIGTALAPSFELDTSDYANISSQLINTDSINFVPTFGDMDGDGDSDMLIGTMNGYLHFFENTAGPSVPANFVLSVPFYPDDMGNPIDAGLFAAPQLIDANRDSLLDLLIGEQSGKIVYYENSGTASAPLFTFRSSALGNVNVNLPCCDGYSFPFLYDYYGNYRLLVGSGSGNIFLFDSIDGNLMGSFALVDSAFEKIREGERAALSGKDITGDGVMDLIVGNYRRGVSFYKGNDSLTPVPSYHNYNDFTLFPNPTGGKIQVAVVRQKDGLSQSGAGSSGSKYSLEIYNVYGEKVYSEKILNPKSLILNPDLPCGIYFVMVKTEYSSVVKKLVIAK